MESTHAAWAHASEGTLAIFAPGKSTQPDEIIGTPAESRLDPSTHPPTHLHATRSSIHPHNRSDSLPTLQSYPSPPEPIHPIPPRENIRWGSTGGAKRIPRPHMALKGRYGVHGPTQRTSISWQRCYLNICNDYFVGACSPGTKT